MVLDRVDLSQILRDFSIVDSRIESILIMDEAM